MSNIYIKIIIHVLHVLQQPGSKKTRELKMRQFSGSALRRKIFKKWRLLLSSNKAVLQVLEAQNKIKV